VREPTFFLPYHQAGVSPLPTKMQKHPCSADGGAVPDPHVLEALPDLLRILAATAAAARRSLALQLSSGAGSAEIVDGVAELVQRWAVARQGLGGGGLAQGRVRQGRGVGEE